MVNNTAHSRYDNILGVMPEVSATPGSVVSFDDGAENIPVKKLKVAIEPVQSGTGDPSPDNIRPISGWTGAKVSRTGKNLFDKDHCPIINGYIDRGTIVSHYTHYVTYIKCKPNTKYTISRLAVDANDRFALAYANNEVAAGGSVTLLTGGTITQTVGSLIQLSGITGPNARYLVVWAGWSNTSWKNANMQIEEGEYTSFEPYAGETYDITFPSEAGTVYGGSLEVNEDGTGTLKVDRRSILIDNTVTCYSITTNFDPNYNRALYEFGPFDALKDGEVLSDKFVNTYNSSLGLYKVNLNSNKILCLGIPSTITTIGEMQTWAGSNPFTIVFPLATPRTYTLTVSEVTTLLGTNNIWADTGDISELTYRADVPLIIEKLKNAIVSLGGTV